MKSPGLYIHIPFCHSKCPYCGFFSVASLSLVPRWLEAFQQEIVFYKGRYPAFDSLYFGGGTPTALASEDLSRVVDTVFTHFTLTSDAEITIEANPCDLTPFRARELKTMGFNRVSLGAQSFDDGALSFLGRRHQVQHNVTAMECLRSCGFENISLDLIYGFEGQTIKDWIATLEQAVALQPEHLSCYQFTFEKRTRFGKMKDKGLLQPISQEREKAFFLTTSRFLEDNGYQHYEISSFATNRLYRSRHNCKYWQHEPYLGLGPSAHSYFGSRRWWNVSSVRAYCKTLEGGQSPVEGREDLSHDQLRFESIMLGLRTMDGFDPVHVSGNPQANTLLERLEDDGLIRVDPHRVIPTRNGFLVADYLARMLGL